MIPKKTYTLNLTNPDEIAWCIEAFCFVAVNCYVLISGYFLINSHSFHWTKVWKLWSTVAFYSLLFYAISVDASGHWDLYKTIHYLLPVRYSIYWFVTAYIGTYLLSPYLARLAQYNGPVNSDQY